MKNLIWPLLLAILVAGASLSATPVILKSHKGQKGLGDAPINCNYCHVTNKIEKVKNQDHKALTKRPGCSMEGCHCEK